MSSLNVSPLTIREGKKTDNSTRKQVEDDKDSKVVKRLHKAVFESGKTTHVHNRLSIEQRLFKNDSMPTTALPKINELLSFQA